MKRFQYGKTLFPPYNKLFILVFIKVLYKNFLHKFGRKKKPRYESGEQGVKCGPKTTIIHGEGRGQQVIKGPTQRPPGLCVSPWLRLGEQHLKSATTNVKNKHCKQEIRTL